MPKLSFENAMMAVGIFIFAGIGAVKLAEQVTARSNPQPVPVAQMEASPGHSESCPMDQGGQCDMPECSGGGSSEATGATAVKAKPGRGVQQATIQVDHGFSPSQVTVQQGSPVKLTFLRRLEGTCATAVVFPALGIKQELPLERPAVVTFTPNKRGTFEFSCPMGMIKGQVQVR